MEVVVESGRRGMQVMVLVVEEAGRWEGGRGGELEEFSRKEKKEEDCAEGKEKKKRKQIINCQIIQVNPYKS